MGGPGEHVALSIGMVTCLYAVEWREDGGR